MKYVGLIVIFTLVCCSVSAAAGNRFIVAPDGSIAARVRGGQQGERAVVLRFGLPPHPADKLWHEGEALRAMWVTNGIRYTQTVLLVWPRGTEPHGAGRSNQVLLVNIEGENTNSDYSEAQAKLMVEVEGKQQDLQLDGGLVWRQGPADRTLLGFLDVPQSGVKVTRGKELCFAGNMPPSLKGSLTLKIPVDPMPREIAAESLEGIDFEAELRRSMKSGKGKSGGSVPS